ncbi:AMP-binding protein [Pseudomonas sp. PCH446]
MRTALESLVGALEQSPTTALDSLSILPADEREQLLVGFNDTALDYPQAQTIHGLFEAQVERTPDALALVHGGKRLSYRELNEQANRLAHALRKQGVQPDSRVGICVERGTEMVVGLLAILKAGGGYVPLDRLIRWSGLPICCRTVLRRQCWRSRLPRRCWRAFRCR